MRRAVLTIALLALVAPAAARAQAPPLQAKLASCKTGPILADRTAVFTGSMPAVPGARRLWMRFDLWRRTTAPGLGFEPLAVPGLGVWQRSAPGRSGFIFSQRVQELVAPGAYRALVRFRWYGRGGVLLRSARRLTATCVQPDWRPDLGAGRLDAAPGPQADQATYRLVVRNDGRAAAGPFDVGLAVDGVDQPPQRVLAGLDAHAKATITFVAPRCAPGSTLRVTIDPSNEIDEAHEADDVVERPCPQP
jgi:CARDB protein